MKTLMSLLVVFALLGVAAFAGFEEDSAAAAALLAQKDFIAGEAAYRKLFVDYPAATVDQKAGSRCSVGHCVRGQLRYAEAIVEFQKALADYPTAIFQHRGHAQHYIGYCHQLAGDLSEARTAYQAVLDTYPNAPAKMIARAHLGLTSVLYLEHDYEAATKAAVATAITYGFIALDFQLECFKLVNPVYLTKAEYAYYLERLHVIVPATNGTKPGTTDNTEFWGRFSSQLDAMNMGE